MPNVLIRDLDPKVHSVLLDRARGRGQSLQQFLSTELAKLAAQPTLHELFTEIEARDDGVSLTPQDIVEAVRRGRDGA